MVFLQVLDGCRGQTSRVRERGGEREISLVSKHVHVYRVVSCIRAHVWCEWVLDRNTNA